MIFPPDLIGVIIPNLNGERFLVDSLSSALTQSYVPQVFVVDNGSTDESIEILQEFSQEFENLHLLVERKPGISNALNLGIRQCLTPFIARLDVDDVMETDRLSHQLTFMLENPEVVLLGSQVKYINEKNEILGLSKFPLDHNSIIRKLGYGNPFAHSSVIMKRDAIFQAGLYNTFYDGAEDLDLWLRMSHLGFLRNSEEALTRYRMHSQQVTGRPGAFDAELKLRKSQFNGIFSSPGNPLPVLSRILDLYLIKRKITFHRRLLKKWAGEYCA